MKLSSLSPREGGEGVDVAEEDDEEDLIEIVRVPDFPPGSAPRRTTRIQVGAQGQPTGTLSPRSRAGEPDGRSPVTRSMVWPSAPPPPSSGASTNATPPPPQEEPTSTTTPPPLQSPIRGWIIRWFSHLANPSHSVVNQGLGTSLAGLECRREWGRRWKGVEGTKADEVEQSGCDMESRARGGEVKAQLRRN
jgi:hypothetical protein